MNDKSGLILVTGSNGRIGSGLPDILYQTL